ncbi:response regulator transcription factor [Paraburkholderia sp.]|jgi:two-component system, NarL family, response regulator, fimbrial Z protein, FimZ|uniref:response regulator transcription factor n=1 Tax=Paraburkholderia sp. TaxID=1926495 RepID=UPI000F48679E|nr:response regulator transcription factor [Paraburkholderia sp.]
MKKIVIVDDHPMVREAVSQFLDADPEFKVVGHAGDGIEGLKMILFEDPDLVVLDLELPGIDGLSIIRRIRERNERIRILILSAKSPRVLAGHARVAGANGYFEKGRNIEELLTVVKLVLFGYDCFPTDVAHRGKEGGLSLLSSRELEVLQYLVRGENNKAIAEKLSLSDKTVSTYKIRIQAKLGVSSAAGLVEFAAKS